MRRRGFLGSMLAGVAMAGCDQPRRAAPVPPGRMLGSSYARGHLLRESRFPAPGETLRIPLVIVGGGIGGLSAGWKLQRAGFEDFLILELEHEAGGNSRSGENPVSAYPWGAHYLPLPTRESRAVRELLADLGVLEGDPLVARPRYDERYLCHTPQERLYRNGMWQEGLLPHIGVARRERDQHARFHERVAALKARRDANGRKAFALPLDLSSRAADLLALDRLSMRDWLLAEGLDAPTLHWYVNYACRDDYGTDYAQVSAWAGLHYYACRDGEGEHAAVDSVLTRPEGNGWIVHRLKARLESVLRSDAVVYRLADNGRKVEVDVYLPAEGRSLRIVAEQAIWAAPLFLLAHVAETLPPPVLAAGRAMDYAPWLVANLTLKEPPAERAGAPLSWDNVIYDSAALGYVVATHQQIRMRPGPTVLTYYYAMSDRTPQQARQQLLNTPREAWVARILAEMERPHPGIRGVTTGLDVFRNGHAMVRPLPGSIWHGTRQRFESGTGRLQFAHADVSGVSLFEEANYRGVLAAERALQRMGIACASSLA